MRRLLGAIPSVSPFSVRILSIPLLVNSLFPYEFPVSFLPLLILLIKLPKRLVGARSLLSLRFISVNIACEVLLSANLVVSFITSRITQAVSVTGFSGEY